MYNFKQKTPPSNCWFLFEYMIANLLYNNLLVNSSNKIVYNLKEQVEYQKAIIDFISGMSDNFAIAIFNEIISF